MNIFYNNECLPNGFELLWYEIKDVIGQGGFGITYRAFDRNLKKEVAIKEFMPKEFVCRDSEDYTIKPTSEGNIEKFEWGLSRFREEAQTLAKFKHPNIIQVHSVFDYSNTAYMVMDYENGSNLETLIQLRRINGEQQLRDIFLPILDGLSIIHEAGFIHRDIKPSNIYIRKDNTPVLLDFGSARFTLASTKTLTALYTAGFAPIEQYNEGSDKQGPGTDIYALGATLYFAITGTKPVDAMTRASKAIHEESDPYIPISTLSPPNYSKSFLNAIDAALQLRYFDRPSSTGEWEALLKTDQNQNKSKATQPNTSNVDDTEIFYGNTLSLPNRILGNKNYSIKNVKRATFIALLPVLVLLAIYWKTDTTPMENKVFFNKNTNEFPDSHDVIEPTNSEPVSNSTPHLDKNDNNSMVNINVNSSTSKIMIPEATPPAEYNAITQLAISTADDIEPNSKTSISSKPITKPTPTLTPSPTIEAAPVVAPTKNAEKEIKPSIAKAQKNTTKKATTFKTPETTDKIASSQSITTKQKAIAPISPPSFEDALNQIGIFKRYFENRNIQALEKIATISAKQLREFEELFETYPHIYTDVTKFDYINTLQKGEAEITISLLKNEIGQSVQLPPSIGPIMLTIVFDQSGTWTTIVTQKLR